MNRIYGLYREEGLSVRKQKPGRHAVGTRGPILVEAKANARCSLNFVHDQFACGRRFRVLNFVEDVTRECLAAIPDTSILRRRVARELSVLIEQRGKPGMIVSDNGTEFTSNAILARSKDHRVESHGITPGSRCKTLMSRASTAGSGTRWSTKACSSAAIMPEAPLLNGPTITIISGRTHRSESDPGKLCRYHCRNRLQRCAR
ncbi:IS3 family insertion sequence transposase domain-containing protein (plasmid) [Rhizobium phaseoli]|nr:IS3 family insertion sequence transposase domain-containing protein [Rhizobium phaseoli]ANL43462.1 IS3 family insertion sequence transposase domain-containing protein [Rhizobium phaseoli]ANL62448.1 IS3 family insertion sequence transposase domain-containing protein [Rhizobium phaseoli]ANM00807.1 IS3 family insertion sequence transposase domain-containing protein [Rhizobium phaseoli]